MKAVVYGEIFGIFFPEEQVIGGAPFNFARSLDSSQKRCLSDLCRWTR